MSNWRAAYDAAHNSYLYEGSGSDRNPEHCVVCGAAPPIDTYVWCVWCREKFRDHTMYEHESWWDWALRARCILWCEEFQGDLAQRGDALGRVGTALDSIRLTDP